MASQTPTLPGSAQCLSPEEVQNVAYTATAGTIADATSGRVLRIFCTTDAFIKIGVDPTATTSDTPVAARSAEYFRANPGNKVSAVQASQGGILYVTEMD